jgi:hypothetical protein
MGEGMYCYYILGLKKKTVLLDCILADWKDIPLKCRWQVTIRSLRSTKYLMRYINLLIQAIVIYTKDDPLLQEFLVDIHQPPNLNRITNFG